MSSLNRYASIAILVAAGVTVSSAHLPSVNDASLQMGRTGGGGNSRSIRAESYSNQGEWSPDKEYRGNYKIAQGDTVSYGTFPPNDPNGKKLWWWAKFYASGDGLTPGQFAPQGGTSPWVLINSLSAVENGSVNYKWRGWNGDMDGLTGLAAEVPTWRDGAEGAYSFTHDDIGAMPFELSVEPGWNVAKDYPDIKQCWGVYVEKMSPESWEYAKDMVLEGHEMFNHSMEHTSAADQWQWFKPGQVVPSHDPAIPEEIRGLKVVGTWGDPAAKPVYPITTGGTMIFESPLVAIEATHYWTQKSPSSEVAGTILTDKGQELTTPGGTGPWTVIEPVIYAKDGVEEITLASGQKQYVKYDESENNGGTNNGFIAATGPTWMETTDLDKYGGQFWQPANSSGPPVEWSWNNQKDIKAGQLVSYQEAYWVALIDAPAITPQTVAQQTWDGAPEAVQEWEPGTFDPSATLEFSTEGEYVGESWSSKTESVAGDKGAPGFVAKVFCVKAWEGDEYKLNIQDASDVINQNLYERIISSGEHFRRGKRDEYYGYPFDAYSEVTHDSLEQNGYVGARGGAKSGKPIPGDFFHPYRIDFDAFYITKNDWTVNSHGEGFTYPDNPHVLLGLNEMVDSIVASKGYMIREFHSVMDLDDGAWYGSGEDTENWPINSAAVGVGGWWGGITSNQLRNHYDHVQAMIDADKITVYTVGEVTKYRLTANATESVAISANGGTYTLSPKTNEEIKEKYRDEISVIVSLDQAATKLNVEYNSPDDAWGISPRRVPRMMDAAGKVWSVSINPFLGDATITPDAEWTGDGNELDPDWVAPEPDVSIDGTSSMKTANLTTRYNGIMNGKISLRLPAGNFTAELFNSQGRMIGRSEVLSTNGVVTTGLSTANVASGVYFLNVTANGAQVMPAAKIMIQ